jgi:pimeloyl-ACP methyl ester carboxylesterase
LSHKTDAYHIRVHPAVLRKAIEVWLRDARRLLPSSVRRLDAVLMAHSYGGRALAAHLAEIGGSASAEHAASRLAAYLADLAHRTGFDQVQMHPIFLSPAYGLNPETARLLRLALPLEMVDSSVKLLPVGVVYSGYQRLTQKPFKWVANTVFKHPQLAGRLVGTDNTGRFMLDFARFNDPHILLPHGRQLETTLSVAPHFHAALRAAPGWNPLVLSGEHDRLISIPAIDAVHGEPGQAGTVHVRVANMTHIECLQDPETIARLIAARCQSR